MKLIIGGMAHGKKEVTCSYFNLQPTQIVDGAVLDYNADVSSIAAINHMELFIRTMQQKGENPFAWVERCCENNPDIIFICCEVGCGVIPITHEEREWREAVGRICCMLAKKATHVVRVSCGIGNLIKGEMD